MLHYHQLRHVMKHYIPLTNSRYIALRYPFPSRYLTLCRAIRCHTRVYRHQQPFECISIFSSAIFPPDIHGPSVINVTIDTILRVNITATDRNGDSLTFLAEDVPADAIFVNTSRWLLMKWTPVSIAKVNTLLLSNVCSTSIVLDLLVFVLLSRAHVSHH